ncbi:MAG: recombinase family protein [Elusimicrobiota bacterium]|nr:MAG: recombinase family protein [Elusimicrobiota bacterium]
MNSNSPAPIRAWAFYRRSTDKQEASFEVQKTACWERAEQMRVEIVREFTPAKGFASGRTLDRDSVFMEMVRLAEQGRHGVRYLFVYSVSRIGRQGSEEKIYWEYRFKKAGIQIISVTDDFKNDGSIGDVVTKVVKHEEAHQYLEKLSRDTLAGCLVHSKKGRSCGGAAPYGYDRMLVDESGKHLGVLETGKPKADKTQRIVFVPGDPGRIGTVKRIFATFERGVGLWTIVDMLNREGIASPRGKSWAKSQVRSLLQNVAYIGRKVYNKRDYTSWRKFGSRLMKPQSEWVIVENAHAAIIEKDLFDRVQARFKTRKMSSGRPYHTPYLLSARLKCTCNHNYQGISKYHEGKFVRSYSCGGYHNKGKYICTGLSFPASVADDYVLEQVDKKLRDLRSTSFLRDLVEEFVGTDLAAAPDTAKALESELRQVEKEIVRVIDGVKAGLPPASLQAELERLESRRASLEKLLQEERRKPQALLDPSRVADEVTAHLKDVRYLLEEGRPEEKKACLAGFLHDGQVNPKNPGITFRFFKVPFLQKN